MHVGVTSPSCLPTRSLLARQRYHRSLPAEIGFIRDDQPASIRESAWLVSWSIKNVHAELTPIETVGAIRFETEETAKRPVFLYGDLVVTPLARTDGDATSAAP